MFFSILSGMSMRAVSVGLVCLAMASVICCSSTVESSHNNITCLETERHALLQFQQGLVDESDALASWTSETDCCKWRGVSCNPLTGHVTTLDLSLGYHSYNYYDYHEGPLLRGEISPSLLELRYLNYLDLSSNDFGGGMMIPKFIGSMSQLKELRLTQANFSGHVPVQLGNLSNLHSLDLSLNDFQGTLLPDFIGSLSQLKQLILRDANFSGPVPPQLGNLSNLHSLDLSRNDFQGTLLPDFIGSLSQLKQLILHHANFSGPVPPQLGNLSNLHTLDLSGNYDVSLENHEWLSHISSLRYLNMSRLDLSKFVNWPRSLSKLTSITELVLSSCQLPDINLRSLSSVNSSASLQLLDLSWNDLNSSIVDWIANVSNNFVSIKLSRNQLRGPVPNVFTSLPSLVTLDLSWNELEGGIPKGFQNLCNLESLFLSRNGLSENIEDSVKTLSCSENTLETLDLTYNQFWGSLPDLKRFSKLIELDLSNNQLNGSLPESVGQLSSLELLDLSVNQLNGSLPESVGQLSSLEYLYLSGNSLSGVITESHFLKLYRLLELDLPGNHFSINISSDWNPPFHQLYYLRMSSCKVGPAFPKWILNTNLTYLILSNAGLSGSLPNEFWDLFSGFYWLDLSINQISGELPNLSETRLELVNMSSNLFSGVVPSFSSNLNYLDLSNNKFSVIGSSLCPMLNATSLQTLDLSGNQLSGELPADCRLHFEELQVLNLGRNKLYGKIPSWLGNLQEISILRLHGNQFSGELPSSLKSCTSLQFLDLGDNGLSGKLPTWIGQSLTNLWALRLRSNQFNGSIPFSMCNLATIHVLDLSHNNISGGLPHCFHNISLLATDVETYVSVFGTNFDVTLAIVWKGIEIEFGRNLDGMRSIDMSSNYLIGKIPESIASMAELISLNLSRNQLTGKLPENFGDMQMLESLDLSRNQISDEIPESFSRLHYLSVLDVSHNHLSGRIPLSTQLQSFNASAYMGNLGLCGPPLTRSCAGDGDGITRGNATDNKEHDDHGLLSLGFLISAMLGFISGFWIVCGSLLLKSSWRYAYFKFLDDSKDWISVKLAVYKTKNVEEI